MKISASIYSSSNKNLEENIRILDELNIDMIHIDFNDKKSDEEKIFSDIKRIKSLSSIPIDLHIISENPSKYFDYISDLKIEFVTFQYETIKEKFSVPSFKKTLIGIAVVSNTSIDIIEKYKNKIDFILLMTTTPGESGGKFNTKNFKKIRECRAKYPKIKIHVDGGINDELGFIMRILGVQACVSGSYLMNHKNIASALYVLKSSVVHSEYILKDFMVNLEECPVLNIKENSTKKALLTIEKYNLGFVMFTNDKGEYCGLVSNADIRKGILNNFENFDKIDLDKLVNKKSITINENCSIGEMLKIIQKNDFIISFIPIIDNKNKLTGCITFWDLIISES